MEAMSIHGPGHMGMSPNSCPRRFLLWLWGGGLRSWLCFGGPWLWRGGGGRSQEGELASLAKPSAPSRWGTSAVGGWVGVTGCLFVFESRQAHGLFLLSMFWGLTSCFAQQTQAKVQWSRLQQVAGYKQPGSGASTGTKGQQ